MPTWLTLPGVSAPERPIPPHLVLVGLPGAGKSTVARALGGALARPVLEFDREIERRVGMSVADLFASRGEVAFRRQERELTGEVAQWPGGMIVDPGGGWITNEGVLEALRPPARVVWLVVEPSEAVQRLRGAAAVRPLLQVPSPEAALEALLAAREARYRLADASFDTRKGLAALVEGIADLAKGWSPVGD